MLIEKLSFDKRNIFFSLLLALVATLQRLIQFTGDIYQKLYTDTFRPFAYTDILFFLLAWLLFYLAIGLLEFFFKYLPLENSSNSISLLPPPEKLLCG